MPFATPDAGRHPSRLRALRKARGIKARPFSELVEVSASHLLNVEWRRKPGSEEFFARCAAELDVDPGQLAEGISGDSDGNAGSGPKDNRPPTKRDVSDTVAGVA